MPSQSRQKSPLSRSGAMVNFHSAYSRDPDVRSRTLLKTNTVRFCREWVSVTEWYILFKPWYCSAAALLTLCCSVAVLAGPYQGNQAADPQYVPSLSLSPHVISQADEGGLVWVGLCDSVSGSVVLSHICRFNSCNYQSAGMTHTGWSERGFLIQRNKQNHDNTDACCSVFRKTCCTCRGLCLKGSITLRLSCAALKPLTL